MWIPKTKEELKLEKKKIEKDARLSCLFFIFYFPFILVLYFKFIGTKHGILFDFTVGWTKILDILPNLFYISSIGGIIIYFVSRKFNNVSSQVCLKCEKKQKFKKNNNTCDCGGELRLLNEMKWVENNDQIHKHE